jgi:uncharacterized protein YndB with AHSA1/START domain
MGTIVKTLMTVILTFEDKGGKTRYTARGLCWTTVDREEHKKRIPRRLGLCTDQPAALVAWL